MELRCAGTVEDEAAPIRIDKRMALASGTATRLNAKARPARQQVAGAASAYRRSVLAANHKQAPNPTTISNLASTAGEPAPEVNSTVASPAATHPATQP